MELDMLKKSCFAPAALAILLASVGSAEAAITVYKTRASYLAAISAPGVDNYDDLDPTDTLATPQSRDAGVYKYTASTAPAEEFFPAGTQGGDVWLSTTLRKNSITFDAFSPSVRGVGGFFFKTNESGLFSSAPGRINFSVTDASGTVPDKLDDSTLTSFLGFVSTDPFISLKLWVGDEGVGVDGVWASVNDLTLGAAAVAPPIPEPETYALMLGGLALLGALTRRNKG
jgi:PEP-CTERM motif